MLVRPRSVDQKPFRDAPLKQNWREVCFWQILLKKSDCKAKSIAPRDWWHPPLLPDLLSGWFQVRRRDQLCQLPKVLGGCCEEEFIVRAVRSS